MRQLSKILSFLMLLVLLTAETCSDGNVEVTREERLSGMFQNIEDEFVNEELRPETLNAFEIRALQKLNDLTDYLNIYANPDLDKQFRMQAKQMVRESFYSEFDIQNFYMELELVEDTTIQILYNSSFKNKGFYKTEFDSIIISQNFQRQTFSQYKGELQFLQKEFRITRTDSILIRTTIRYSGIIAQKTEKEFGSEIQPVWEVFLGEIK